MTKLEQLLQRYPVLLFVALTYAITWSVWFAIPLFSGGEWSIIKILTGVGLGPGLAAVLLDRLRRMAGAVDGRWWRHFIFIFVPVTVIHFSVLFTGDGITSQDFASAAAPGLSAVGIVGSLLSASLCGFVFASAATSRSATLNAITRWRVPLRWWLIAMFLPALLALLSIAFTQLTGEELPPSLRGGLPTSVWLAFILRSALFTLLVVGVGEETGWRGWMLPELQKRYSPLRSSIMLGVVWGLWHFPLFFNGAYSEEPAGVLEYLVIAPLMAILYTWIYNRTAGNLLLMLFLHMSMNNTQRLLPATGSFFALLIGVIVTVVFTERMWRKRVATDLRPVRAGAPLSTIMS